MEAELIKRKLLARCVVDAATGCWIWTGASLDTGHGTVFIDGRTKMVYRVAFEVYVRPLSDGEVVDHQCNYPPCFNPDHLQATSQAGNVAHMNACGRHGVKGTGPLAHKFVNPHKMVRHVGRGLSVEQRLLARRVIDQATGCWLYAPGGKPIAYGRVTYNGKSEGAHRVAAMLWLGMKPEEWALHKCDTPACFNPEHLFRGDHAANNRDKIQKGRHASQRKTHCKHGHPLSGSNLRHRSNGARQCRKCINRQGMEHYRRLHPPKTSCRMGHALVGNNLMGWALKHGRRVCKACHVRRNVALKQRRQAT